MRLNVELTVDGAGKMVPYILEATEVPGTDYAGMLVAKLTGGGCVIEFSYGWATRETTLANIDQLASELAELRRLVAELADVPEPVAVPA